MMRKSGISIARPGADVLDAILTSNHIVFSFRQAAHQREEQP